VTPRAIVDLIGGELSYEQALQDYFAALVRADDGDVIAVWSIDGSTSTTYMDVLSCRGRPAGGFG
jgi:hypothetical protein